MGVYVAAIYMPYIGRIAVLKLQTSDSWALMRSSGAVRGVEGALDGFWGGDQGICGLVTMERVWVHVWLRYTPYSGRIADLKSRISAGKRSSGAIRRVLGAAGGSGRGEIRELATLGWHRTCRGMCDCDMLLPMAVLRR